MCGRFYLDVKKDELISYFSLSSAPDLLPRYNIAPSQDVPVVLMEEQERQVRMLRWGLIPFWAKDEKIGYSTINARAETVESKPAFRAAFKYRRCLIPASGFFEWKPGKDSKQPFCIRPRKAPLFAFAGLYEHWDNKVGKTIDSCSIIVTDANRALASIHDRMAVILSPDDFKTWLDPNSQIPSILKPLLIPLPSDMVEFYPVSRRVNSPKNDDPECIAPVS